MIANNGQNATSDLHNSGSNSNSQPVAQLFAELPQWLADHRNRHRTIDIHQRASSGVRFLLGRGETKAAARSGHVIAMAYAVAGAVAIPQ